MAGGSFLTISTHLDVSDVPVTYITTRHDRPVPHELQLEMIGRLPRPVTVVEFDTGHIPAVTHPDRFAEAILGASA